MIKTNSKISQANVALLQLHNSHACYRIACDVANNAPFIEKAMIWDSVIVSCHIELGRLMLEVFFFIAQFRHKLKSLHFALSV